MAVSLEYMYQICTHSLTICVSLRKSQSPNFFQINHRNSR